MIKAIFCDFYGTVVFEDDELMEEIAQKVFVSSNAGNVKEIGSFWSN